VKYNFLSTVFKHNSDQLFCRIEIFNYQIYKHESAMRPKSARW